jgi:hypothetical protein
MSDQKGMLMTTTFALSASGIRKIVECDVRAVLQGYDIQPADREAIVRDIAFRLSAHLKGAVQEAGPIALPLTKQ